MRHLLRAGLAIGVMGLSATAADADNLVPNPGFETCTASPSGWAPVSSETLGCDQADPFTGARDAVLSGTSASNGGLIVQADSGCVPVSPNAILTNGAVSYRTSDQGVYQVAFSVFFYGAADCSGSPGSVSSIGGGVSFGPVLVKDGQWQTLTGAGGLSVPSDAHGAKFRLSFQFTTPGAATVAFDALSYDTNATTSTIGTTTTTTTPGSTTSTTSPIDCALLDCDDGDGCTTDACVAGTCSHTTQSGIAGAQCLVTQMQTTPVCGGEPVPVKPSTAIARALDRTDALLTKLGAASGKRRAKLGKMALGALAKISKTAAKASRKEQISTDCAEKLTAAAMRIRTVIGGL